MEDAARIADMEVDHPQRMARQLVLMAATAPVVRVAGMLNARPPAAPAEAAPFDWVDVGMRGLAALKVALITAGVLLAALVALISAVTFGVFG